MIHDQINDNGHAMNYSRSFQGTYYVHILGPFPAFSQFARGKRFKGLSELDFPIKD